MAVGFNFRGNTWIDGTYLIIICTYIILMLNIKPFVMRQFSVFLRGEPRDKVNRARSTQVNTFTLVSVMVWYDH
jgi:hypothetical protein